MAWKITCASRHIAVLSSTGSIILRDSVTFCTTVHAEVVAEICFNTKCDRLASYGFKTTKIWTIPAGQLVAEIPNPAGSRALAITFADEDSGISIGSNDKMVRHLCLDAENKAWHTHDPNLLQENSPLEGGLVTSPSSMAFNADATQIAVTYRGYPLSVWATNVPRLIGRCKRKAKQRADYTRPSISWAPVSRVAWNPLTDHLVGLYKDGCVFKWDPIGDENQEAHMIADEIQVSPDGKIFITSTPTPQSKSGISLTSVSYTSCLRKT